MLCSYPLVYELPSFYEYNLSSNKYNCWVTSIYPVYSLPKLYKPYLILILNSVCKLLSLYMSKTNRNLIELHLLRTYQRWGFGIIAIEPMFFFLPQTSCYLHGGFQGVYKIWLCIIRNILHNRTHRSIGSGIDPVVKFLSSARTWIRSDDSDKLTDAMLFRLILWNVRMCLFYIIWNVFLICPTFCALSQANCIFSFIPWHGYLL